MDCEVITMDVPASFQFRILKECKSKYHDVDGVVWPYEVTKEVMIQILEKQGYGRQYLFGLKYTPNKWHRLNDKIEVRFSQGFW